MKYALIPFLLLLLLLATSAIAESDCPAYDHKAWKHWVDEDKDCQNARHEVLFGTF